MTDWIEEFVAATESIGSCRQFRLWSAIGAMAGALERRVWTATRVGSLFPNMYIVLVGEPAAGKTLSIREARKTIALIPDFGLGPDNPTKASFFDQFEACQRTVNGFNVITPMTCIVEEWSVFMPKHEEGFCADLSNVYDNPEKYTSPRRTSKSISLEKPTLNIIAAATPAAIGQFPDAAWNEGFTSRLIMIYGTKPTEVPDMFEKRQNLDLHDLYKELERIFTDIHGEIFWDEDARLAYNQWRIDGMKPVPEYGRLSHYNGRRATHVIKLAMVSSASANNIPNVTLSDFNRALEWLTQAESTMPDVFRAMKTESDDQILQSFHYHLMSLYGGVGRKDRKPIPRQELWKFLSERVPSDKIQYIIDTAENMGLIIRGGGFDNQWIPVSKI